jgi:shikimate kinase
MPDPVTARVAAIPRTIALVGLMGCGKSHIGRRLAAALGRVFYDSDTEVEAAAGRSVREIFADLGEPAFRDGERKVIARLIDGAPVVLATGGGAFIDPLTRAALRERALCVWLRADLDLLVFRTAGRTTRPLLLTGDPRTILGELMEKRYPVYAEAPVVVDTRNEPSEITTERVLEAIDAHWQTQTRQDR